MKKNGKDSWSAQAKLAHSKVMVIVALLLSAFAPADAEAQIAASRERGIGPFRVETKRGPVTVRFLRREGSLIWVDQLARTGQYIETGIQTGELVRVDVPRPAAFDLAEQAATTDQVAQVQAALKKVSDALRLYRDLPGVPVDEALFLQARLLEKKQAWRDALPIYEDIARQPYKPAQAPAAALRAGICSVKLEKMEQGLAWLDKAGIPDDDLELLSDAYFSRAQARAALGRHEEAVMDYLHLVVFSPFAQSNEVRCLAAVLPSYAAMEEWDAVWKTVGALKADYPDAAETEGALEFVKTYEEQLARESEFQTPEATETGDEE